MTHKSRHGTDTAAMSTGDEHPTNCHRRAGGGGTGLGFLPVVVLAVCCSLHLLFGAGVLAAFGAWVGQPAVAGGGIVLAVATLALRWRARQRRLTAGARSVR